MEELTNLETKVMQKLLAGDNHLLAGLRRQLEASKVRKREMTGVGFFKTLDVPAGVPRVANGKSFKLGEVNAITSGSRRSVTVSKGPAATTVREVPDADSCARIPRTGGTTASSDSRTRLTSRR